MLAAYHLGRQGLQYGPMVIDDGGLPARCLSNRDQTALRRVVDTVGPRLDPNPFVTDEPVDRSAQRGLGQRHDRRKPFFADRTRWIQVDPNQSRVGLFQVLGVTGTCTELFE